MTPTPVDPTYPFRKGPVLLATDGTEQTDAPLIAARALAARLHLPLEVVSVLDPMPIYAGSGDAELPLLMEVDRRSVREASVRRYVDILTPPAERWRLHLRCGSPAHEIAAVARERTASVVVVGASPHRRFGATVAGARAAQVLRRLDCPVLSVAPDFTGWPVHAVVGVDFAAPSIRAAEAALRLLEDGATLTLVHVLRMLPLDPVASDVLATRVLPRARALLSQLCTALTPRAPTGVKIQTEIVDDGVEIGLIEYSQSRGAGLIAVGTHGPGVLERLFVGSSAVTVLHAAECSVLACPPPPAADRIQLLLEATDTVTAARREDWATLLNDVSARNVERTASVEIDDLDVGAQIQGTGLQFMGATYDPHDDRVELMLANGQHRTQHLTRAISGVESVALYRSPAGRDLALEVRHAHGSTILTFGL